MVDRPDGGYRSVNRQEADVVEAERRTSPASISGGAMKECPFERSNPSASRKSAMSGAREVDHGSERPIKRMRLGVAQLGEVTSR
jgi:hypothetical protein